MIIRRPNRSDILWISALFLLAGTGCGEASDARRRVDGVEVSPATVTMAPGESLRFTATTSGTAGAGSPVTWMLGESEAGSIDVDGTYHAPHVSPLGSVHVHAVSSLDSHVYGTAIVAFTPRSLEVSPAEVEVVLGQSLTFTATVTGAVDQSVVWSAFNGSIDANGTFQAPVDGLFSDETANVRATSTATGEQGRATVRFKAAAPNLEALSGPATAEEPLTLTGSGLAPYGVLATTRVLFTAAWGGIIEVTPDVRSDTALEVKIPSGAASGPVTVELSSPTLGTATSNPLPFTRVPRLRMHAERSDLASGESTRLPVGFLGATGPVPVTYEVDAGAVSGDVYTAPTVTATTYVNIRACVAGSTNCSGSTLAVHPVRVEPVPALVRQGETLSLEARSATGPISAPFTLLSGGGTLTPAGLYTPSAALADAGQAWGVAGSGATAAAVQLGVRGQVPGLLHRMVDYVDHRTIDGAIGAPRGSRVEAVAVGGTRAYVLATYPVINSFGRSYHWIDVYDVEDPLRPIWLGAVESVTRPNGMFVAANHLYAWAESDWSLDYTRTLAVYDLSGSLPAVEALDVRPRVAAFFWAPPVSDGTHLFAFGTPATDFSVPLQIHSLGDGGLGPPREVVLRLAPGADVADVDAMTATGDRAWAVYMDAAGDRWLATWNLAVDPPALLGVAAGGGTSLALYGSTLCSSGYLFDVTADVPAVVGFLPYGGTIVAGAGSRLVLKGQQSGYYVLDVANPQAPVLSATLYTGLQLTGSGAFAGDVFLAAENFGGLAMYDVASQGGPMVRHHAGSIAANAMATRSGFLYGVGANPQGGGALAVLDLSVTPAELSVQLPLAGVGFALAVGVDRLLVGTTSELQLWSLTVPALPELVASVPLDVNAVQLVGDIGWVGTLSGDLVAFDLAAPAGPVELGRLPLGAPPFTIDLLAPGALAVGVASSRTGDLIIVDVTDPSAPIETTRAGLAFPVYSSARQDDALLLATAGGLVTVDVADPLLPVALAIVSMPGAQPFGDTYEAVPTYAIGVGQGIAWVGTGGANGAIHGFDVRNPAWPREVSRAALGGVVWTNVLSFAFDGTRGFTSFGGSITELDMSQPRNVVMTMAADPALLK